MFKCAINNCERIATNLWIQNKKYCVGHCKQLGHQWLSVRSKSLEFKDDQVTLRVYGECANCNFEKSKIIYSVDFDLFKMFLVVNLDLTLKIFEGIQDYWKKEEGYAQKEILSDLSRK